MELDRILTQMYKHGMIDGLARVEEEPEVWVEKAHSEILKWIKSKLQAKREDWVRIMRDIQLSSSPGERAEDMNRRIIQAIIDDINLGITRKEK